MPESLEFFEMLADVRRHIVATGRPVEANDNPKNRSLGYKDGEKIWCITLIEMKRAMAEAKNIQQATWVEMFRTPEGRMRLVDPTAFNQE